MEKVVLKRIGPSVRENQNPPLLRLLTCLKVVGLCVSVDERDFSTFCSVFSVILALARTELASIHRENAFENGFDLHNAFLFKEQLPFSFNTISKMQ